jgi:uncharacterized protein YcgI (DUF1989 family)
MHLLNRRPARSETVTESTAHFDLRSLAVEPRERIRIPKQSGRAFTVSKGELVRVIDVEGEQVADLVCFSHPDRTLRSSTDQTRDVARTLYISVGHALYAHSGEAMLTIVADDVRRHDLLYAWCRPEMYRRIYGQSEHPNCHDNLLGALEAYGVTDAELPMPFNIFQNTVIHPDGRMEVKAPLSSAGDGIVLRAERDLLVAVSACSVDRSPCNGYNPSPIDIEIYAAEDNRS